MLFNKNGEHLWYGGKKFSVGNTVSVKNNIEYSGLFGRIIEIRSGGDKETDNASPDIYCSFFRPKRENVLREIEKRFSEIHRKEVRWEDLGLERVIMPPEMLECVTRRI